MSGLRKWLQASSARYRCVVCGGVLTVFHLCPGCLHPVHPGCAAACHLVPVVLDQGCQGSGVAETRNLSMPDQRR